MLFCGLLRSPFREADSHRFGGRGNDARPDALGGPAAAASLKGSNIVESFRVCAGGAKRDGGGKSLSVTGNNGASEGVVNVSAFGRGSDSLGIAVVGADSFNSTDSSMHPKLLEGPASGIAGTWRTDVPTVAGSVEVLAGCWLLAPGLAPA